MRKVVRIVFATSVMCVVAASASAAADEGGGYFGGGGGVNDIDDDFEVDGRTTAGGISSRVTYFNSSGDTKAPGVVEPVGQWEPPACWFEPYSASEAEAYVQQMLRNWRNMPDSDVVPSRDRLLNHFVNGQPYENYNLDIEDEGSFWFGVPNPSRLGEPEAYVCSDDLPLWVENGETPDQELALTPEMLAAAAYEWLPLPETEIEMSPDMDGPQTVNLASWIWHDTADIGEVSATAELESLGLSATTVATPSALHIDPGTADAVLHPSNGECTINANGTIGEPYTPDRADDEPPCGITYQRATTGIEPYQLTATITWSVTWTGTGTPDPQPLPDAVLETTHDITVEEVQTIIR
jgi:hypothetical protein